MGRIFISLQRPGSTEWRDCVTEQCIACGRDHDKVWSIERKLEPWGHFATATINGQSVVIDASLPHVVDRVPRDARTLTPSQLARIWHEDNESHVFGGPNVAKALRQAIAEANAR